MSSDQINEPKTGLKGWTTRDLMVTAVIGIVFGPVLAGAINLSIFLMAALTPLIGYILVFPIFVLAGLTAPYIIRKPGAAVISELVSGLIMVPFTPVGFTALVGRLIEGVLYEAPFLATRYRRWGWMSMMLSAGLAVTVMYTLPMLSMGGFNLELSLIVLLYAGSFVAGAIGGALTKTLADAVAKTGVLASFAIGQQEEEI